MQTSCTIMFLRDLTNNLSLRLLYYQYSSGKLWTLILIWRWSGVWRTVGLLSWCSLLTFSSVTSKHSPNPNRCWYSLNVLFGFIKVFYIWELFAWSSYSFSLYFYFINNRNLSAVWRIQTLSQCKSKVICASLLFLVLSQVCMAFMFEEEKKSYT